jgi:3-deoxy-7-phosphoheptulonate synthase
MIVVMSHCATEEEIKAVSAWLEREGFQIHLSRGVERTIIGAIGDRTRLAGSGLEAMQSVERVVPILQPYKLASRTFQAEDTIIRAGGLEIGGDTIHVIAGIPERTCLAYSSLA